MINLHTKVFAQNITPNTFIGGVAKTGGTGVDAVINTPYLLANRLAIDVNRITGFKVLGDDIQCRISGAYIFPPDIFILSSNITYYKDTGGIANSYFQIGAGTRAFTQCQNIREIKLSGCVYVHESFAQRCPKLDVLEMPNLANVGNQPFWGNPKLTYTYFPLLVGLEGANWMYMNNSTMIEAENPNINKLYGSHYSGCVKLERAIHDQALSVGQLAFNNCSSIDLISLKKAKSMVATSTPQYVFNNIKTGCLIKVNDFLRTSKTGGLPDDNLTYAKDIRGATVEFYDDAGNYVSTL